MKDGIERHTLGVVVIAIVGALMLTAVFGGKADFPGSWLYDYQTLITGLLALGAAFITVNQMKRSDAQSRQNHLRSLDFESRPERMLFDRLRYDCKFRLSRHADHLRQNGVSRDFDAKPKPSLLLHIERADAVISCREISSVLSGDDWQSAQKLFPALLSGAVRETRKTVEEIISELEGRKNAPETAESFKEGEQRARELDQALTKATNVLPDKIYSIVGQVESEALKFERSFEP